MIVFFYGYVYQGYYENDVDRCFNYLSGYADNSTTRLGHLVFHPEGEPMPLSEWSTRDNAVGLSRLKIMRRWERERYIKARSSGNVMPASNITFIYPSMYFTM